MSSLFRIRLIAPVIVVALTAACGASSSPSAVTSPQATDKAGTVATSGDIPDNVVWLTYSGSGFSIQYPEGWVHSSSATGASFSDKDSHIAVAINTGAAPTTQSVTSEIGAIPGATVTAPAQQVSLLAGTAIKVSYEVLGNADPVTGKQPRLTVVHYDIGTTGRVAVLELAAQVGVDNVDAYLTIAKSFKWLP
ncbi:MAG: hypothetical protein M3082_02050 [Candidatus Dormibacteraeota bacterium]|nr:hypothetical protein [Candidatus Dormibacteraeota bacterium]